MLKTTIVIVLVIVRSAKLKNAAATKYIIYYRVVQK